MEQFWERFASIWRPHAGQREFLASDAKIKVLACGRRWGKTDACAAQVVAALHRDSPSKHLLLAPTLDQARLLFDRTVELLDAVVRHDRSPPEKKGKREAVVRRSPFPTLTYRGHRVIARSGHIGRSLRGNEATHIVVDEAAYVPEDLITEIAMPMLATTEGMLTLISTPHGLNHFWRFFRMGQRNEHGVWSRTAPSSENPLVGTQFLEIQKELISQRAYLVEYEAKFLELEGKVFRDDAVRSCIVPRIPEVKGPWIVGIDWGRYNDCTAVAVICGDRTEVVLCELEVYHAVGWSEQMARVGELLTHYPGARVICDATGFGDPMTSRMQDALPGHKVEEFVFTRPSKTQLVDGLADLFEAAAFRMEPDPALLRELEHFEMQIDGELEARRGYHDDMVIALGIAATGLRRRGSAHIKAVGVRKFGLKRKLKNEVRMV
jgi:hypothetical protein